MSTTIYVYPSAWNTRMEMCHTCRWECDSCSKAWALCRFIYCFNDAVCFIFMYFVRNDEIKTVNWTEWCNACTGNFSTILSIQTHVFSILTHWGRVTHICVLNLTIIGQDNGLSPGRRQAIIWTNAGILLIGPLGTNFSEILIEIHTFSFKKMRFKLSSGKWRPFYLGLNVLKVKKNMKHPQGYKH